MPPTTELPIPETVQTILTADPAFVELAVEELGQADLQAHVQRELAPGVLLVDGERAFHQLATAWRDAPPIFVRHICPVHAAIALEGASTDLPLLEQTLVSELVSSIAPNLSFSVQSRVLLRGETKPFAVNSYLADVIQAITDARLDVRQPQQVLSVILAPSVSAVSIPSSAGHEDQDVEIHGTAFMGLSKTQDNLSDWAGGTHRFAREPDQVSRAEFKLLEALETFGIDLPPRGVALDLGAAPGGWTRILRQRDQYVTAVDPAALHPSLVTDRYVRHLPMTAEQYLADEPDQYDIIVNDMRMDGRDSARVMVKAAPQLYAHGIALMTIKLPAKNRLRVIDHAFTILREAYQIVRARQLFHNRSEITLYLKKKTTEE